MDTALDDWSEDRAGASAHAGRLSIVISSLSANVRNVHSQLSPIAFKRTLRAAPISRR